MLLTVDSLRALDLEAFGQWYDETLPTLRGLKARLEHDLLGFANQSGSGRLAFHRVRLKERRSALDKLYRIQRDEDLLRKLNERYGRRKFRPQEILGDLVAARMVFYFEPDRELPFVYFHTYPTFRVDEVELYELLPEGSALFDETVGTLLRMIRESGDVYRVEPKKFGYESLHLTVRYNTDYLALRESDCDFEGVKDFDQFPIEIQIRTMLQDTWAQMEHTLSYARRKRPAPDLSTESLVDEFRTHKLIVKACERFQNLIWRRHRSLQQERVKLTGASLKLGHRLQHFVDEHATILDTINSRLYRIGADEHQTVLTQLLETASTFSATYVQDFFKPEIPDDLEAWGRQRVFLLLFGYLMTFGNDGVRQEIHQHLRGTLPSQPIDPRMTAVALFEKIRFLDKYFCSESAPGDEGKKRFFRDAVVHYRCAGAYFGEFGYYRRAIDVMGDALSDYRRVGRLGHYDDVVINEAHLQRRLAEYYWAAFNLDGRTNDDDLSSAYMEIRNAWKSADLPNDANERARERRKILADLLSIALFRAAHSTGDISDVFGAMTEDLVGPVADLLDDQQIQGKGHSLQALSIWRWRQGDIIKARAHIAEAAALITVKASQPFHIDVVNEIRRFLMPRT